MDKFIVGDVVELNSGSPLMVVAEASEEQVLLYRWDYDNHRIFECMTNLNSACLFRRIT